MVGISFNCRRRATYERTVSEARLLLLASPGGSHLNRRLFGAMLRRIELLPLPTG